MVIVGSIISFWIVISDSFPFSLPDRRPSASSDIRRNVDFASTANANGSATLVDFGDANEQADRAEDGVRGKADQIKDKRGGMLQRECVEYTTSESE